MKPFAHDAIIPAINALSKSECQNQTGIFEVTQIATSAGFQTARYT